MDKNGIFFIYIDAVISCSATAIHRSPPFRETLETFLETIQENGPSPEKEYDRKSNRTG